MEHAWECGIESARGGRGVWDGVACVTEWPVGAEDRRRAGRVAPRCAGCWLLRSLARTFTPTRNFELGGGRLLFRSYGSYW